MQFFSADATIFLPSNVANNRPQFIFEYCQPAQNQPKSQFLFHKSCSPRDLCIMTLAGTQMPEHELNFEHCGTYYPGWLNGDHPTTAGEIVNN